MINPSYLANYFTALERAPYDERYQAQMADVDGQIAAWGEIETAITSVQTAAKALYADNDGFNTTKASVLPENSGATVSTGSGAIPGHHELYVEQVAKAQQESLNFGTSGNVPAGTLTISGTDADGNPLTLSIDTSTLNPPTVESLSNAINAQGDDLGVSASVLKDDTGSYNLVVTSDDTGTDNAFTVSFSDPSVTQKQLSPPQNAIVWYGGQNTGIKYESASNTITDMIPGVTINVTQPGQITIDVVPDTEAITTDVQAFVDSYNAMLDVFTTHVNTPDGALYANGSARGIQNSLKQTFYTVSPDGMMMANYGITSDPYTGKLTLDTEELQTALTENPEDVAALFKDVATQIDDLVYNYTATSGTIYNAQQSLDKEKASIQSDMDALDRRMDKVYQQYLKEFTEMVEYMNIMNATSAMFQ
ncbi:FliD family flagellar hook-associated protein [Buttiauxella ferragutiae ATCC 51602]|jgi:flagellar hook-associated protein 2|uniref:Flagellar hook-associated protein 2 n=1 Tax=Buttiauxella ferragutiae ATCC 51602 TaxID=1354252 RepID=A0ABX2W8W4_9ENTR|nr:MULTISPECIES: flagellar filament capping protein FliD [Buttiauxella]OAT28119.1 FliD family flagellar hook-associated protein [Buttiauxella ferragutiae ATCC 51602]TDN49823.1 flagellar hook-associated protein 2 [Buttiauxella sp. JUb87]